VTRLVTLGMEAPSLRGRGNDVSSSVERERMALVNGLKKVFFRFFS